MITIPVAFRTAAQKQTTTLDGRRYEISLDWIQRLGRWTFSLATESGDPLISGKGLALRADLLRQNRYDPRCPQGALMVIDTEGDTEPGLESLGGRHALVYFSAEAPAS